MKLLLLLVLITLCPVFAAGQARTAERIVDTSFSQLDPTGRLPNGSIRNIINGTQGTTPCTGGGTGALGYKVQGVWQCPKLTPGAGTGDVLGVSSSVVGQIAIFTNTNGKNIGPLTVTGILSTTNGVPVALSTTGTGPVVLSNSPVLVNSTLTNPVIGSFNSAQHAHDSAAGGGQLNAANVFNAGTVPTARIISGSIINSRCLRTSNTGQIEVAAADCGSGSGGSPGGVSGNLAYNESGSFGGVANSTYSSAAGTLTFIQLANGNDTVIVQRATDSGPTGTLLRMRDATNTTDLFSVNAGGGIFSTSNVTLKTTAAPATPSTGNTVLWADITDKNLKAQDDAGNVSVTLRPISCSGTDKISSISSAGVPTCTADQGGTGTGVITLNTLNTSDQTFAAVSDTNVTLAIGSSVSTHTFTIGWTGTLAKARQHTATVYSDASNAWTTGAQSFAAATSLVLPSSAGAGPTASGQLAYDTTSNTLEAGVNGTNRTVAFTAGAQTLSDKTLDNSNAANLRDSSFTLQDNVDSTKTVNFELGGLSSGTNRIVTVANAASVTVQPTTATTNQFVTHIDSAGVVQKAQPSFANLSGTIPPPQGGTGQTAVAQGDLLYGDAANSWARLSKSTAATRYLSNTGASNNPAWAQVDLTNGVTGILLANNGGTANGFFAVSGPTTSTKTFTFPNASAVVLTDNAAVTIAQGGTGQGTQTAAFNALDPLTTKGDILVHNGTNSVRLAAGTNGQGLVVDSTTTEGVKWATFSASAGGSTTQLQYNNSSALAGIAGATTDGTAVTFSAGNIIVGGASTPPTPALGKLYVDTDDGKLYYGIDSSTWGEVFTSGLSVVNLASANVTGVLPLANGGTNQASWTAARCVRVNAGGTALEAAAADCGSGGGSGTVTVVSSGVLTSTALVTGGGTTTLQTPSATATLDSSGNMSLPGSLTLAGTGAGYLELAEGTIPTAVANRVTVAAPTDVTATGWVMSLPTTGGTSGQFLQTNGSGVTTWATPSGSGTVTATGGSLTSNAVVLGAGTTDTKVVAGIVTDGTSKLTLGVAGTSVGSVDFKNATSGTVTLAPVTGALGTVTLSLPARTATVATTTGTLTSGRCVEIDASGNLIQAAAACGSGGGSGTINSGVTNNIPKYIASTTIDDSLLSDDGAALTYSGTGGLSLTATGGGYIQFTEGTAPALVGNTVQHGAVADVMTAGVTYLWGGTAAADGLLWVSNTAGVMTVLHSGASQTKTFTNTTYDVEATGNVFTSSSKVFLAAAGCQNTTAASFWDLPTTTPASAACVTGTNIQKGVLDFADTSGGFSAQNTVVLPGDFTGTIDARILWTTSATSGNAKWSLAFICTAVDATETDDPAFNTASTVTTAAPGVANRVQTSNITSVTITGCAANELLHVRTFRDGNDAADTISATARLVGVELTIRRAQ